VRDLYGGKLREHHAVRVKESGDVCGAVGGGGSEVGAGVKAQTARNARTKSAKLSCRCGMPADAEVVDLR